MDLDAKKPAPNIDPSDFAPSPRSGGLRLHQLMFVVGACALLAWVATVAGIWLLTGSLVLLFACAIGGWLIIARRDSTERDSLLWALAIAAERSQPLGQAALAFSEQYAGDFRARVRLLCQLLDAGKPLPEALDRVPGLLPPEAEVLARTGWATGTLPQALRMAAASASTRAATATPGAMLAPFGSRLTYLIVVLLVAQTLISFIMYFITPKLEAIFKDFGQPLPAMTVFTIRASHFIVSNGIVGLAAVGAELLVLACLPFFVMNIAEGKPTIFDRFFHRRHAALVLKSLALPIEGGKPIQDTLRTLGASYPSAWAKQRLRSAAAQVSAGTDWVVALRSQGLISGGDAAVLASAERAGNLPWAIRETASSMERRSSYRLAVCSQVLFPLAVLAIGGVVFVYATAYFLPLVQLIEALS